MQSLPLSLASASALAALGGFGLSACRSGPGSDGDRAAFSAPAVVAEPMAEGTGTAYEAAALLRLPETPPENHPALHNVYALSENIISGGEPENEEAFRILQDMGVRTILSVDGKVPDAALAERYGMKYVHVPIQYKGITAAEVAQITKTFREQEGPFYVHCFHGKHRGPAAAAQLGRLVLDGIAREAGRWPRCASGGGTSVELRGSLRDGRLRRHPGRRRRRESLRVGASPPRSPLDGIVAGAMIRHRALVRPT